MFRYRLYTENLRARQVKAFFDRFFPSYTATHAHGVWKGKLERSIVFEVITRDEWAFYKMRTLAIKIRELNGQDSVLVTREPVESFLFEGGDVLNTGKWR